ncbi:helix-turn-helix transcriptional regulator [Arthrobacter castelli]|uniref:helix-turn-helix transcriptional regulator n=1 Tax=Arthrobacter castelli TaxID=271431 RepID=UPI00041E8E2A|nr:LuxR family transcriptional regulator [Arthrobacter castelli]
MLETNHGDRLVGRSHAISTILGHLRGAETPGVLVVGDPGMGKTAVAQAVMASLTPDDGCVRLTAGPSLSRIPFGALTPLLTRMSVADVSSPEAVVRGVREYLLEMNRRNRRAPVIIADDAHALDEESATVLSQLVGSGVARLLVLARAAPGPPDELLSLWRDGLLDRVDLEPLNDGEVQAVCHRFLGQAPLRSVAGFFARASAGNPMFLLALMAHSKRQHHLVQRNGQWILIGDPPAADIELADLVSSDLSRLSGTERHALEAIALAEPMPLSVLRRITGTAEMDSLAGKNIIAISDELDPSVRPVHPVYGEVLRRHIPAARSLSLRQRVAEAMDGAPTSMTGLLNYVGWALDCGTKVDDRQLFRAAAMANKLYQPHLALRAAEPVQAAPYLSPARVEMARAHYTLGNLDRSGELLDGIFDIASNLRTARAAAFLSAQLRLRRGDQPARVCLDADAWETAVHRIGNGQHPSDMSDAVTDSLTGSRLLRYYGQLLQGDYGIDERELAELAGGTGTNPEVRLVALTLLGELQSATGRPDTGSRTHARAMRILRSDDRLMLTYHEFVVSRCAISLIRSGQWEQAQLHLTRYLEECPQTAIYLGGFIGVITGLIFIRQGLLHSALGQLRGAVEALHETDLEQLLPAALGMTAFAAAAVGEDDLAREFVEQFHSEPWRGSRQLYFMGQCYAAAAKRIISGVDDGGALQGLATEAGNNRMHFIQQLALELAVRVGADSAITDLEMVAKRNEGHEAKLLSRFGAAVRAGQAAQLQEVSRDAAEQRFHLIAADCLVHSVRILEADGQRQRAKQASTLLDTQLDLLEGATLYQGRHAHNFPELTARERDIARYVAKGSSNRGIAQALDVSVRTVEGHIYRIFAKLDISRRDELTDTYLNSNNE